MPNTVKRGIALIGFVLLAACEQSPVQPQPDVGFQPDADVAGAVDASWDLLTSEEDVYLETLEALSAQPNAQAEAVIMQAADRGEDGYIGASLIVLGADFASRTVDNVELAVSRVDASLAGRPVRSDARQTVDRARSGVDQARSELARGNDEDALRFALDAADDLRSVDPERRATEIVQNALRLLEKAKELAGPDARPDIAELLREADTHCDAAVRALDAEQWELAVREAIQCATIARRVIFLLSGGVPSDRLEERAKALVAHAQELYERAVTLAGDDPQPKVARALEKAEDYLREAKAALDHEDWREAVRLARESIKISERVIDFLINGGRDEFGVEPDRPIPL